MIDQKAKEYAEKTMGGQVGYENAFREVMDNIKGEIEAAYRAGYQAGLVEATRREFIQEQPTHFERGMT